MNSIHVNPPSFVRRLRHFNFAENLRHGDENLRHLTVTARKKNYVQFFILHIKNGTNFSFRFDILVLSRTLDLHPGLAAKCALIRDLISARRRSVTTCHPSGMPEHLLPEDYSDTLRAEFMEFAMATDAELPPMDAFWVAMATCTTAGGDHPFATLSAVMKVYLIMPHSNADSERVFSMVNKIDTEHRSELVQDTIAALLSVKVNCTADTHSYEPPATVLHMSKKATMNYNLPHRNTP